MSVLVLAAVANEVLAGIAQAAATVVAVVIGYGLSALSEKKARKAVFDSQDRDRRLEAVVDILDNLMQLRAALQAVSAALSPVGGPSNSSATARASHQATVSTAQRLMQPVLADATQNARLVARLSLTVRVLGAGSNMQDLASEANERSQSAVEVLIDAVGNPGTGLTKIDDAGRQIDASIEQLLVAGREAA